MMQRFFSVNGHKCATIGKPEADHAGLVAIATRATAMIAGMSPGMPPSGKATVRMRWTLNGWDVQACLLPTGTIEITDGMVIEVSW